MASKGKASVTDKAGRWAKYEAARQEVLARFTDSDDMSTTALATALLLIDIDHGIAVPDVVTVESWRRRRGEVSRKRQVRVRRG